MLGIMIAAIIGALASPIFHFIQIWQEHVGKKMSIGTKARMYVLFAGALLAAIVIGFQYSQQIKSQQTIESLETRAREHQAREALNAFHLGIEARPYIETRIIKEELELEHGELGFFEWDSLLAYFQALERDVKARYWALGLQSPAIEHIGSPAAVEDILSQLSASRGPAVASWFAVGFYSRFALHRVKLELNEPFKRLVRYKKISDSDLIHNLPEEVQAIYVPELFDLEVQVIDTYDIPPPELYPSEKWIQKFELVAKNATLPQNILLPFITALHNPENVNLEQAFDHFVQSVESLLKE